MLFIFGILILLPFLPPTIWLACSEVKTSTLDNVSRFKIDFLLMIDNFIVINDTNIEKLTSFMPPIYIFLVYLTIQMFIIVLFEKTAIITKNIQH